MHITLGCVIVSYYIKYYYDYMINYLTVCYNNII